MTAGGILNEGDSESRGYPLDKMLNAGRRNQKIVHLDHTADRTPPHSKDAEMSVLGAMMLDKEASSKVIQIVPADAFYYETHRIVYTAMLALTDRNQPIDIITLNDELRRMGKLADVGGSHYLSELNMRTPTAANVEFHARIIFEKALKRRLISAATEIIGNCYSETTDAFEEVDHAEQKMFEIAESRNSRSYHSMKRLAHETIEMLETISSRFSEGGGVIGVPSGLVKLDNLTGGFQRSDLAILAARPSMGKCIAWDTPIVDPQTGAMLTAAEFHRRGSRGENLDVLTLSDRGKMERTTPSDYIDDGIKPLFLVRTRLGREVRTTITHPYLTPRGWKPLGKIAVGDRIAVPRTFPVFGSESLPAAEIILMAYLIGDGGLTQDSPRFTTTSEVIRRDIEAQAHAVGVRL
ncbi:MAG: DnaB-like helicase N-terminal domain-containing protein, partial [Bacteroidota bacterium]